MHQLMARANSIHQGRASDPANEIDMIAVKSGDVIVIQTANSLYVFWVVEPSLQRGLLSGGSLGQAPVLAYLFSQGAIGHASKVCKGGRALFFVEAEAGFQRVSTSPITGLVHRRP